MVDHDKYRNDLMDGAIKATAEKGIEGMTTRAIAGSVGLNEAYIYRYYRDRNDLLEKAFLRCDQNMMAVMKKEYACLRDRSLSYRDRFFKFMNACWDYAVEDYTYALFYVRFYFSTFYNDRLRAEHLRLAEEAIPSNQDVFLQDIEPRLLINHIYRSALVFIMDLATGRRMDTPEERKQIFTLLYNSLAMNLDTTKIPNFYGTENE